MVKRRSSSKSTASCLYPLTRPRGKTETDEIVNAFKDVLITSDTIIEPHVPTVDEELRGKTRRR